MSQKIPGSGEEEWGSSEPEKRVRVDIRHAELQHDWKKKMADFYALGGVTAAAILMLAAERLLPDATPSYTGLDVLKTLAPLYTFYLGRHSAASS